MGLGSWFKKQAGKTELGRGLMSTVANNRLEEALVAIVEALPADGIPTADQKAQARRAVTTHIANLNIEDALRLFNDIRGPRFAFIRRERGSVYGFFSDHGRTDTYRHCLTAIQARLIDRFRQKHPIRAGRYQAGNGEAVDLLHRLEDEPHDTLHRMREVMEASYYRTGCAASNANTQAYAALKADVLEKNGVLPRVKL